VASSHTTEAPHVPIFEKREELHRILASKQFCNSPKKTRFLEFVCEQTLVGNGEKLNEYLIGVEVYERGTDFNPQRDPIVRVQAYEIRRLLKKYYEEEGKSSAIRMDLPSGHYVPVFSRNADSYSNEEVLPPIASERRESNRMPWVLAFVFGALCVVLAVLLVSRGIQHGTAESQAHPATLPDSLQWFWKPFVPPADAPLITIPNHPLLRAAHD